MFEMENWKSRICHAPRENGMLELLVSRLPLVLMFVNWQNCAFWRKLAIEVPRILQVGKNVVISKPFHVACPIADR